MQLTALGIELKRLRERKKHSFKTLFYNLKLSFRFIYPRLNRSTILLEVAGGFLSIAQP